MTVDLIKILSGYGQSTVDELKRAVQPYSATGDTVKSIRFEVTKKGELHTLRVLGRPYIMALETGRKATPEYKPSRSFVERIRRYLQAKGQDTSFAYAVAQSIHKKGTKGHPGVITNVVNDSLYDRISQDILQQFAKEYLYNVVQITRGNNT